MKPTPCAACAVGRRNLKNRYTVLRWEGSPRYPTYFPPSGILRRLSDGRRASTRLASWRLSCATIWGRPSRRTTRESKSSGNYNTITTHLLIIRIIIRGISIHGSLLFLVVSGQHTHTTQAGLICSPGVDSTGVKIIG